MELKNRVFLYAAIGAFIGLTISLWASTMYGVAHAAREISVALGPSGPRLPSVFRVAGAYIAGGAVAGALWGGLLPPTNRLWGAVTVAFIGALPVFMLLFLAVGAERFSVGVLLGILMRSIAWGMVVGIGWIGSRVRVIGRTEKSQSRRQPLPETSKGAAAVQGRLKYRGMFDLRGRVITGGRSQTSAGRPAAHIFLAAAGVLRVEPGHCLVFEDASSGLEAALAAAMAVVRVLDRAMDVGLFAREHQVITSLEKFMPEDWGLFPQ